MKSARRRAYIERKTKKTPSSFRFWTIAVISAFILGLIILIGRSARIWKGDDKAIIVYKNSIGDIAVSVLNPKLSEITTFEIPGDTQVELSQNYGTLRIKNVWQFGVNEKLGGTLLAETVTQNFLFPVKYWCKDDPGISEKSFSKLFHFVFTPGMTNVPLADRVGMAVFTIRMQDSSRSVIDLAKSQFLSKKLLNDGQVGYLLDGKMSERLTVYFSDAEMSSGSIKVNITDATLSPGVAEKVGEIIEVLGGKVVSIEKKVAGEDVDCTVVGKNSIVVRKIADLFSCKLGSGQSMFDIDLKIGKGFAQRF